jgi:glucose/arabinose dehydrogenase
VYVACLRGRKLYRVSRDGSTAERLLDGRYGRLRTVAPAPDGSLWVITSNTDGRTEPKPGDDRVLRLHP